MLTTGTIDAMIEAIVTLIKKGIAYQVDVPDIGSFVCLDNAAIKKQMPFHFFVIKTLTPFPVWYHCLDGHTKTERMDVALWAPYKIGNMSPWGRGQPTVNLDYILPFL